MPTTTQNVVPRSRFFPEQRRAPPTPSASPSLGSDRPPTKRTRLRSTPSSSISATPSTSNESSSSADVNSARRASTLRVLNTWAQLAERYNKRLDEDDIIDLHRCVIIKDRGAVERASTEYHIGHFSQVDSDQESPDNDNEQDQEESEQDEDENELGGLPLSEATTDDDAPISKKELLRGVPPLSTTTDAEDLREFLEAEERRKALAGDEEDEEGMSPEQRSALREELEKRLREKEAANASRTREEVDAEFALERDAGATPTRPSTRVPPSNDESEDELALWTHDESTAVHPVARHKSKQDIQQVDHEVIEITESDSDEEFEAILTHPPRFTQLSPLPASQPKEAQQLPQSPPDSKLGRSKSRPRSHSKMKATEMTQRSEDRPRVPPVARTPEVVLPHKKKTSVAGAMTPLVPNGGVSNQEAVGSIPGVQRDKGKRGRRKPSVSKEAGAAISDEEKSSLETPGRISPVHKGKDKAVSLPVEKTHREKTPKPLGARRGRKRKRISSSSINGSPLAQSPGEPKRSLRSDEKSISQSSIMFSQPRSPEPTLDNNVSTPVRFEPTVAGPSYSSSSFSSASKNQTPVLSVPARRPLDLEPLTQHDHNSGKRLSDLPSPVTHPYPQRHPSYPPSFFSSPNQGTPGISLPSHPPPQMDPVQTQQAHYLLAQAMHQLSCLISATMPPYPPYTSNPGQPWHYPPPSLPPHPGYSSPIPPHPHPHGNHHYPTPSSSISGSGLPVSSPILSSVSPPVEEQRARSRGRNKTRGRRVSFKLDKEEVIASVQLDPPQKTRKQCRETEKGKATEEPDSYLRLEDDRGSPPQEVSNSRGRTPGPPSSRKKVDLPRGRSLNRR